MPALVAILLGCGLGTVAGGSIRHLAQLRFRYEWIILLTFVAQGVARGRLTGVHATSAGTTVWIMSSTLLMLALLAERRRPGVLLAWTGVGLNLVAVLANNGMPVVLPAGVDPGLASASIVRTLGFYQVAGKSTLGAIWGDVLVVKLGAALLVLSPGDVLLATGVAVIIAGACLGEEPRPQGGGLPPI